MNVRDRMMRPLRGDVVDKIPWFIYEHFLPRGQMERELRNNGLGILSLRPVAYEETPNVRVEQNPSDGHVVKTYHTPLGKVSARLLTGRGSSENRLEMDWMDIMPWTLEYLIKRAEDYEIVKFIIDDTVFHPYYDAFLDAQHFLGEDGVVVGQLWRSPFQKLLVEFTGAKRLFIDLFRHPDKVESLYRALYEKTMEQYAIAASSPAEFVGSGDNVDGVLTNPKLFEKYCLPFYNAAGSLLHEKKKIYGTHMDGRLSCLAELISASDLDVIESVSPPPMGDLSLLEARSRWGSKVIIANFPATICLLGQEAIERKMIEMLRQAAPGRGFMLGITENVKRDIFKDSLYQIGEVMEKAEYPLSE
jgi:hypothetical protein